MSGNQKNDTMDFKKNQIQTWELKTAAIKINI